MSEKIATGNRLADGLVVYLGETGWVEDMEHARRAPADDADALLADAQKAVAANEIADVWLIDVEHDSAVRRRERIRAVGPTVRPDLGRAA